MFLLFDLRRELSVVCVFFFFQAEDGIRDAQESRGLGDVYKRQVLDVINLHLKSRRPTNIQGHKLSERTWKTAFGWAEGVFISSMKPVSYTHLTLPTIYSV
mgnify:CR=1 FL=1